MKAPSNKQLGMFRKHWPSLIALALFVSSIPMGIACYVLILRQPAGLEQSLAAEAEMVAQKLQQFNTLVEKDKELFLTSVYADVKSIDETMLPVPLRDFVIRVKVSQFGK